MHWIHNLKTLNTTYGTETDEALMNVPEIATKQHSSRDRSETMTTIDNPDSANAKPNAISHDQTCTLDQKDKVLQFYNFQCGSRREISLVPIGSHCASFVHPEVSMYADLRLSLVLILVR